ncbi:hypothetical protein [Gracilimonas sediminicola]|uniref:Uncharacterized protein n=1 Tax=Gracilimonas sediminicola TaxID=2952158 RepID=A0A9X2L4Y3_9BACT|nr:hypothetical protein [Gracilimonas sediminicola]MCP9292441.1 hypothetical protein [Gracilimonas sediminicola]
MKKFLYFLPLLLLLLLNTRIASAHPWGGLVIDQQGNIYFTFICPFVDEDHYACVWQIDDQQNLKQVLESSYSPSDIILSRSPDRVIYGAERNNAAGGFQARLWRVNGSGNELIINPTTNEDVFFIQAYAVAEDGMVYFARENRLFERSDGGEVTEIELPSDIDRIDDLAWGLNNKLYILDRESIKVMEEDGSVSVLATGLKEENPENIPFSGANILFDFTVDKTGNVYLAYYGNRRVLKVSPAGEVSVFLESEGPWSPHGVDVFNGEVYVLESTFGTSKWWEFWEDDVIIPRVRKVDANGGVYTVLEYRSDREE